MASRDVAAPGAADPGCAPWCYRAARRGRLECNRLWPCLLRSKGLRQSVGASPDVPERWLRNCLVAFASADDCEPYCVSAKLPGYVTSSHCANATHQQVPSSLFSPRRHPRKKDRHYHVWHNLTSFRPPANAHPLSRPCTNGALPRPAHPTSNGGPHAHGAHATPRTSQRLQRYSAACTSGRKAGLSLVLRETPPRTSLRTSPDVAFRTLRGHSDWEKPGKTRRTPMWAPRALPALYVAHTHLRGLRAQPVPARLPPRRA